MCVCLVYVACIHECARHHSTAAVKKKNWANWFLLATVQVLAPKLTRRGKCAARWQICLSVQWYTIAHNCSVLSSFGPTLNLLTLQLLWVHRLQRAHRTHANTQIHFKMNRMLTHSSLPTSCLSRPERLIYRSLSYMKRNFSMQKKISQHAHAHIVDSTMPYTVHSFSRHIEMLHIDADAAPENGILWTNKFVFLIGTVIHCFIPQLRKKNHRWVSSAFVSFHRCDAFVCIPFACGTVFRINFHCRKLCMKAAKKPIAAETHTNRNAE